MTLGDIIVIIIIVALVVLCARSIYKRKKSGGCCGDCSGCSCGCGERPAVDNKKDE